MTITPDANSALLEYRWPGANISEFKNRMEKVFINRNRLVLGLENIPLISDKITVVATMISSSYFTGRIGDASY